MRCARREAERALSIQPEAPRALFTAGVFALRVGDLATAEERLDTLKEVLQVAHAKSGDLYRDALDAEIRLVRGETREAVSLLERVVQSDRILYDRWTCHCSSGAAFRDALARGYTALGDQQKVADTLDGLISSGYERLTHPVLYVRSLYALGKLRLEFGDRAAGERLLQQFLDHWGGAD